jgi:phosphopantetheinyl transferase (holo-ACP synthase)
MAMVWAAKEAAFKLISRELDLAHFVPREFVTGFEDDRSLDLSVEFSVSYESMQARVCITASGEWVHAIAMLAEGRVFCWRVKEIADCGSHDLASNNESSAVRLLAGQLLSEFGRNEALKFDGWIPVLRDEDGNTSELAVSLSHHGAYAAVAIGWSPKDKQGRGGSVRRLMQVTSSGVQCSTCMA